MDRSTCLRCGLLWLICMLFVIDGNQLIRADEKPLSESCDDVVQKPNDHHADRPSWFEDDRILSAREAVLFVETTEPCMNVMEAERELRQRCEEAVGEVLQHWHGIGAVEQIDMSPDYICDHLVVAGRKQIKEGSTDQIEALLAENGLTDSGVKYYFGYAQLHLDEAFYQSTQERWTKSQTRRRLVESGLIGGAILATLAVIFGYLKMETATRGFYSRRLQTISAFAVLLLLTIFFWLSQHLVWS